MIWFDGQVRGDGIVPFNLRDRGLSLADGLFETVLVVGGVPFRLADHLARLSMGANVIRLDIDLRLVAEAIGALAGRLDGPGVVRVTATRGAGPRGLAIPSKQIPTIFAVAAPWSPSIAFQPQRLAVSTIRRNEASPLSRVKSLAYLDNILALDEATAAGADEALMLSSRGRVACASASNLFILNGTTLSTPPVSDGVLPGTTRALLMELARRQGFEAEERSLALDDLCTADAVILTNSLRLICPVTHLDGRAMETRQAAVVRALSQSLRSAIDEECASAVPWPADGSL